LIDFVKDSIDFEEHLEPIRPAFEARAKRMGEQRINPVTGVILFNIHITNMRCFLFFLGDGTIRFNSKASPIFSNRYSCCSNHRTNFVPRKSVSFL